MIKPADERKTKTAEKPVEKPVAEEEPKPAEKPTTKFDFYTLLPEQEVIEPNERPTPPPAKVEKGQKPAAPAPVVANEAAPRRSIYFAGWLVPLQRRGRPPPRAGAGVGFAEPAGVGLRWRRYLVSRAGRPLPHSRRSGTGARQTRRAEYRCDSGTKENSPITARQRCHIRHTESAVTQ